MCYSAMIEADYRRYMREWGAELSIREYVDLFWWKFEPGELLRGSGGRPRVPRALEQAFLADPQTDDERAIADCIRQTRERQALEWQRELFAQRTRQVKAEHQLLAKPTRSAAESHRIATAKIGQLRGWLDDLTRAEPADRDSRIYPGWYAPVMVVEAGRRVVRPMRYQCRPAGKPAAYDRQYPGTYNARRDNLEGFWRGQFGVSHGVMIVTAFFENVRRDGQNVVLEFRPRPRHEMLVACLWSHWTPPHGSSERELLSFAAITDEPPPEVAAAGHDRCIIPIRPEHLDAWLTPNGDRAAMQSILQDRDRPYYEHRLAA